MKHSSSLYRRFLANLIVALSLSTPCFMSSPLKAIGFGPEISIGLACGAWTAWSEYCQTIAVAQQCFYVPSPAFQELFDNEIRACGMDPEKINVRYEYCQGGVALSLNTTILVNPHIWLGVEDDEQAKSASRFLDQYVAANGTRESQELTARTRAIMTPAAQKFIFRHELGHIYHHYFGKKIAVDGIVRALSVMAGYEIAYRVSYHDWGAFAAWVAAVATILCTDRALGFVTNATFQVLEEKLADQFAAKFSTADEIDAAAQFFEDYQKISNDVVKDGGLLWKLPMIFISGHPDGATRGRYLREWAREKRKLERTCAATACA